jgi:hypothetical protein
MGDRSKEIIANWGPERFAEGFKAAAEKAIQVGPVAATLVQRILLGTLARR